MDEASRLLVIQLSHEFVAGALDRSSFLSRLEALMDSDVPPEVLELRILERAVPEQGLYEILQGLSPEFNLWLMADLPPLWVLSILDTTRLTLFFPSERILDLTLDSGMASNGCPFKALSQTGQLHSGATLLVDRNARRATAAIRQGWDVAIYVDAPRLRRDLGLWGILPFQG
jgi:hypothetical protein